MPSAHRTDGLMALSGRWMQPTQQQGRRLPSRSSSHDLRTRRFLVSICLAFSTQQIYSLRASGVMSSHRASTFASPTSALRKSAGILCTVPPEISFVAMLYIVHSHCAEEKRIICVILRGSKLFLTLSLSIVCDSKAHSTLGFSEDIISRNISL